MKKVISVLTFVTFISTICFAQKVIKFKTTEGKKAKVTIPGKLVTTLTPKDDSGNTEYYVEFDSKNQQVIISMVMYSGKSYMGSDVTYCKYDAFDKRFLSNIPLQEASSNDRLMIEKFYSYSLSAKDKFPVKSNNSFTGVESTNETSRVAIRFSDEEVAKAFIIELKQNVGL
jgi:hypothetical protein